jgi:hypothetical protein
MAVDDLGKDVGEAFDSTPQSLRDDRLVLAAAVGGSEPPIFAIEGDRTDCPFDCVGVDLNAAVVEEGSDLPSAKGLSGSAAAILGVCRMRTSNLQRPAFRPLCANSGHSQTVRRTGQVGP